MSDEDSPLRDPPQIVAVAYGLALLSVLVPLAVVGALFAGLALARRNRRPEGAGVVAVAVLATLLGILLFR